MALIDNDNRELRVEVYLSAIAMTDISVESGNYSFISALADPQNTRPLNFDYAYNEDRPFSRRAGVAISETRLGRKVKFLPSLFSGNILEVSTHPSASSCTFAYGGIGQSEAHPTFNLLYGPTGEEYTKFRSVYNVSEPRFLSNIEGLKPPETSNLLSNYNDTKAFIPFIQYVKKGSDLGTNLLTNYSATRTSYNIWHIIDDTKPPTTDCIKYEGPIFNDINSPSIRTIRDGLNGSSVYVNTKFKQKNIKIARVFPTSYDAVFYNPTGVGTHSYSKKPANIFYPTVLSTVTRSSTAYTTNFLDYDEVYAQGEDNVGFHLKIENLDVEGTDSKIIVNYDGVSTLNKISSLSIELVNNALPIINLVYNTQETGLVTKTYKQLRAPLFGTRNFYDIFVHFVGPNLLIGFENDQTNWNTIFSSDFKRSSIGNSVESGVEFKFEKDKSFVSMNCSNVNFTFKYSTIIFDNYNFDLKNIIFNNPNNEWKALGSFIGAIELDKLSITPSVVVGGNQSTGTVYLKNASKTPLIVNLFSSDNTIVQVPSSITIPALSTSATFIITTSPVISDKVAVITAEYNNKSLSNTLSVRRFGSQALLTNQQLNQTNSTSTTTSGVAYSSLVTKNHILMNFKTTQKEENTIAANNLLESLITNKFMSLDYPNQYNRNSLNKGGVSIYGDWRNTKINNNFSSTGNTSVFRYKELANIANGNVVENFGKLLFNGTIEGPVFMGLRNFVNFDNGDPLENEDPPFLKKLSIKNNFNISSYVKGSISVNCKAQNPNLSYVTKSATINLANLDFSYDNSDIGLKLIELIEHNVLVITVRAGYGGDDNLLTYFQGVITNVNSTRTNSNNEITLSCEDLGNYLLENIFFEGYTPFTMYSFRDVFRACMKVSGFYNYFFIKNPEFIGNLNDILSPNPSENTQILLATRYDRILERINQFLSKMVKLPTVNPVTGNYDPKGQPTFRWQPKVGFLLDARWAPGNTDELKFTGIDYNGTVPKIISTRTGSGADPGWHGVLNGGFTINTNINTLTSRVETYGNTVLDGYIAEETDQAFEDNALSSSTLSKIQDFLNNDNVSFENAPRGYVGFKKTVQDNMESGEIFSRDLLKFKHDQNVNICKYPYHSLSFDCYVTRPLQDYGTFIIKHFLEEQNNDNMVSTDKYIYESVSYTIDKNSNLITARVGGVRQPWTIKELEIRNT